MRGAITHIWMSPDTRKKSRYGLRTLGGIAGIAALAILCVLHASGRPVFRTPMQRGLPVRNKALQLVCNPGFIVYFIVFIAMSVVSLYAA